MYLKFRHRGSSNGFRVSECETFSAEPGSRWAGDGSERAAAVSPVPRKVF